MKLGDMPNKKEYSLLEAIEEIGSNIDPNIDIVALQIIGSFKSPIVRVFIDHKDGVSFDLLTSTQNWIGKVLDEIDPFPGSYTLEVSSPGPNRPLRKAQHFKNAIGKTAKIKCNQQIEGRKNFTGTIKEADGDNIVIALDEGKQGSEPCFEIPISIITAANLKEEF